MFGNNLTKAIAQARANAHSLGHVYYVVTSTNGLYVERLAPTNPGRVMFIAYPDGAGQVTEACERANDERLNVADALKSLYDKPE